MVVVCNRLGAMLFRKEVDMYTYLSIFKES